MKPIFMLLLYIDYDTFFVLEFSRIFPLAHYQYNGQLWTYFVSYDVSLALYRTVHLYIEIPDQSERVDVH